MGRNTSRGQREKDKQRKRTARQALQEPFVYHQVDDSWKQQRAKELNLPISQEKTVNKSLESIHLSVPTLFHQTSPDGNCFFNALSFVITGTEAHHYKIRSSICSHLLSNIAELKAYLPARYGGDAEEYMRKSKMSSNRTWATEVEIFTAADLLRTNIYVYTKHGVHWKWLKHGARQVDSSYGIYLYHKSQNHYDVVLGIGNAPVINEFTSDMQKYFVDQLAKERDMKKKIMEQERYKKDIKFRQRKKMKAKAKYDANPLIIKENAKARYRNNLGHRRMKKAAGIDRYHTHGKYQAKKKAASTNRYHTDTKYQAKKKAASTNRYHTDTKYQAKKKASSTNRYHTDTKYQAKKKESSTNRYHTDTQYRANKKGTQYERYHNDDLHRNQKKKMLREKQKIKYKLDKIYKEEKKQKTRERYAISQTYRECKRNMSILKYATNSQFRHLIRKYGQIKYKQQKEFREKVKRFSIEKYKQDKGFHEKAKEYSKRKYKEDTLFQDKVKKYSTRKYKEDTFFHDKVKKYSEKKYKEDTIFQDKLKKYSKRKYKEDTIFHDKVKKYSKRKYKEDTVFQDKLKKYSKRKYKEDTVFQDKVKNYSKRKYQKDNNFKENVKEYSKRKYKERADFREKVKEYNKKKYSLQLSYRRSLKASSIRRYLSNPFFRIKIKQILREEYQNNKELQLKKKESVQKSRKCIEKTIRKFRKSVSEIPKFACTVCGRLLYRNQIKVCKRSKYMDNSKLKEMAEDCLTGKFIHSCIPRQCKVPCSNEQAQKEWICYTCDRHLAVGNMPPQALANGMQLEVIPDVLKKLNGLERQLVALRIPFMKLLSLPKGGQKGVKGQVVNVPSDLNSVTKTLPRTVNDAQMVRVKLKRKLSYKGHHQYEWVNPKYVVDAVKYLIENNPWYSDIQFRDSWFDPTVDSDIIQEGLPERDSDDDDKEDKLPSDQDLVQGVNIDCTKNEKFQPQNECKQSASDEDKETFPIETCFQPLDLGQEFLDTNNRIFCVAPAEGQKPQNMFQEKGADAMAFPALLPTGKFGLSEDRQVKLSPSKYFNARLFSADDRFAKSNPFIFFAQYMVEINNIRSNISLALRKGKETTADGKTITASMLTNSENLQKLLKSDTGFRFLQPVRGTPPYWQRTMKDLYAMIRQLGIPTWFVTFSAGETRWKEVITALMKEDQRDFAEVEWLEKCQLIRDNPVMCARLFNNRVKSLFTDLILSPSQPIGPVVDYFFRTEFQQRGSPHIHCLFWVKDAPKLDKDSDKDITLFVDKYVSCQLPDQAKDPELYDIVSSVQMHSKSHTKSCRKHSTTCRFHFPRPPVLQTFIARADSKENEISYVPDKKKQLPTAEEFDEICKNASQRSAKDIVKAVWTAINSAKNLEDCTTYDILQIANVTYSQFKESLETITTKNCIFYKRKLTDSWVNNYNKHLLRAWNANLDIQFVMDAYSCVAYILSYISKAEAEVGELLVNAKKEAKEGNKDAAAAMKHIGQAYVQNREISAQEATYRVCGMHLKECSRDVIFVPTGENCVKMSLPIHVLKMRGASMEDSENIWMSSVIDKYLARPHCKTFEEICLAEFCSQYTFYPMSRTPKKSTSPGSLPVYSLQHDMGYVKKKMLGKEAIIRYPRFNRLKTPDQYYLTLIQLYVPHRQSVVKPPRFKDFEEYVRHGTLDSSSLLEIITEKRNFFEQDADSLEKAWEDLQEGRIGEDAWAMVAPEAEAERIELEEEKEMCHVDEFLEDEVPEIDISEKDHKSKSVAIQYEKPKVSEKEIRSWLRQMNKEQQQIFYRIREWAFHVKWNKKPQPFCTFVTGGAGTGKSHLIKCVYHEITRILSKTLDSPDAASVLLTAPTGTAAFNIGGMTLHSTFAINKNIRLPYVPLGESILNTLRTKFENIQLLIIDEISMVDHKLLTYIHGRLCQVRHSKKPFGNISVLAVGDFYQLPPVRASPLYKLKDTVVLDLWNTLFNIATLTQVMRQKEDVQFAEMLNRLRVHVRGEPLLSEDIATLSSVACDKVPDDVRDVLHIFPTNREVNEHNDLMVDMVCNPCVTSVAKDYYRSTVNGQLCQKDQPYTTTSPEDLLDIVKLGVGARVMLTRNVDTEDGLVNGAFGTVKALELTKSGDLKAVYVKFDNSLCGRNLMSKTSSTIPESKGSVRIVPIEDKLNYRSVMRQQLPLKLGWAATIHKVQGMTVNGIVVSLKNVFQPGMAYVALSRATSLTGLHIVNLDTSVIYASQEIKQNLDSMPQFIKKEHKEGMEKKYLNIVLHNTEGILPHKDDIQKADIFATSDITCFTETWLSKNMYIPTSLLPDCAVHTAFRESSYSSSHPVLKQLASMSHGGVATFVKKDIQHHPQTFHLQNLEYVVINVTAPKPVTIISIYRPPVYPANIFSRTLQDLLSAVQRQIDIPVIIMGDFNDNFLGENPLFEELFQQFGYKQLVKEPTTESGSCLDVVLTNIPPTDIEVSVKPLYYSFHDAVSVSISI